MFPAKTLVEKKPRASEKEAKSARVKWISKRPLQPFWGWETLKACLLVESLDPESGEQAKAIVNAHAFDIKVVPAQDL